MSLDAPSDVWAHVQNYVLSRAFWTSVRVAMGAAFIAAILGSACGWISSRLEFTGRRWLERFWIVGLAFPPYVSASAWMTLTSELRNELAAIFCLGLAMFPYVFLFTRQGFSKLPLNWVEAARSMGASRFRIAATLRLRAVTPWLLAGSSLVALEALADFGTVGVFNVKTLALEVYQSWVGLQSIEVASRLCLIQVALSASIWAVFSWLERRQASTVESSNAEPRVCLGAFESLLVLSFGVLVILLSWGTPLLLLLNEVGVSGWLSWIFHESDAILSSILLSAVVATLIALFSMAVSYRLRPKRAPRRRLLWLSQLSQLGYAIPGSVLAISAFGVFFLLNQFVKMPPFSMLGFMVFFLALRFLSVGFRPSWVAIQTVPRELEEAAQGLGARRISRYRAAYWPTLTQAVKVGWIMVFLDTLKEVPITLMLRPFGFETITVRFFQLSLDGLWLDAAAPALTLGLVSILIGTLYRERASG